MSCSKKARIETTIGELPEEIIIKILGNGSAKDIVNFFLIDSRFFNIINNSPSIMRQIRFRPTSIQLQQLQHARLSNNFEYIMRNPRCFELYNHQINLINTLEAINLDFVEQLELNFCTFGSVTEFKFLLNCCKCLKNFTMCRVNIGVNHGENARDENCAGRNIDILKIHKCTYNDADMPLILLKALISERISPKKFDFEIEAPYKEGDIEKFRDVFTYVNLHFAKSLKILSITNFGAEDLHTALNILGICSEIKLKKFQIHQLNPEFKSKAFEQFFANQSEITHFEVSRGYLSEWHLQTLTSSLPNLSHLRMSIDSSESFNRCVHRLDKLKHLHLRTMFHKGNLNLPKNLETLDISAIRTTITFNLNAPLNSLKKLINDDGYIAKEEMVKFFKYCPNMEHLEMTSSAAELEFLTKADTATEEISLANWKKLQTTIFQKEFLHDNVLTMIDAPNLREMVWKICIQEQLAEICENVKIGLNHLAEKCPKLEVIKNFSGNPIYQRNKETSHFVVVDEINWQ